MNNTEIAGIIVRPYRKWWIVILYILYLIPHHVLLRFTNRHGRREIWKVKTNLIYECKLRKNIEFVDPGVYKFYALICIRRRKGSFTPLKKLVKGLEI